MQTLRNGLIFLLSTNGKKQAVLLKLNYKPVIFTFVQRSERSTGDKDKSHWL
jgi:hypothetical protein